jgi:hypothetical protein
MADGEEGEVTRIGRHAASPQVAVDGREAGATRPLTGANGPPAGTTGPPAAATAPPKEPGWYPVRTNPNEQVYWNGADWTGRRRWSAGTGWIEVGPDAPATAAAPGAVNSGARLSANPYAPHPTPTTTPTARPQASGVTIGIVLLMASAIAMMVGSVTTWISSSGSVSNTSLGFGGTAGAGTAVSAAVSGVSEGISGLIGINGFITLIAAVVVLVFAGLMAVSDDGSVRIVGCLVTLASLGVSIYAVVRLAQKLNQAHVPRGVTVNVGWGVILTLGAAVLATLLALFEATRSR